MNVLQKFIRSFRIKSDMSELDARIAAEAQVMADADDIIAYPNAHMMHRYWAKEKRRASEQRLRGLKARKAIEEREAEIRSRVRPSRRQVAAHPYDPFR